MTTPPLLFLHLLLLLSTGIVHELLTGFCEKEAGVRLRNGDDANGDESSSEDDDSTRFLAPSLLVPTSPFGTFVIPPPRLLSLDSDACRGGWVLFQRVCPPPPRGAPASLVL